MTEAFQTAFAVGVVFALVGLWAAVALLVRPDAGEDSSSHALSANALPGAEAAIALGATSRPLRRAKPASAFGLEDAAEGVGRVIDRSRHDAGGYAL
jgi:hypothetical protein